MHPEATEARALDVPCQPLTVPGAPRLSAAQAPLLRDITVVDEYGDRRTIHIPAERALTVFVDRKELVRLMTLGASPELLVLGWHRRAAVHAGRGADGRPAADLPRGVCRQRQ